MKHFTDLPLFFKPFFIKEVHGSFFVATPVVLRFKVLMHWLQFFDVLATSTSYMWVSSSEPI